MPLDARRETICLPFRLEVCQQAQRARDKLNSSRDQKRPLHAREKRFVIKWCCVCVYTPHIFRLQSFKLFLPSFPPRGKSTFREKRSNQLIFYCLFMFPIFSTVSRTNFHAYELLPFQQCFPDPTGFHGLVSFRLAPCAGGGCLHGENFLPRNGNASHTDDYGREHKRVSLWEWYNRWVWGNLNNFGKILVIVENQSDCFSNYSMISNKTWNLSPTWPSKPNFNRTFFRNESASKLRKRLFLGGGATRRSWQEKVSPTPFFRSLPGNQPSLAENNIKLN